MPDTATTERNQCVMHTEKIHELELAMVEMKGDVKHIRERIDNGLSSTVTKVWDMLNSMSVDRARMDAVVAANSSFIEKLRDALIKISVGGIIGGVVFLAWKLIEAYIKHNIPMS